MRRKNPLLMVVVVFSVGLVVSTVLHQEFNSAPEAAAVQQSMSEVALSQY